MAYTKDIYQKAKERLAERRMNADRIADLKRKELYKRFPELKEIDIELAEIGVKAARSALEKSASDSDMRSLSRRSMQLQDRTEELLKTTGLTSADMEPVYHCSQCCDTGYIEKDNSTYVCECFKKLMSDIECEALNSESPLSLCTFDSFDLNYYDKRPDSSGTAPFNRMSNILKYCLSYADNFTPSSKSILMRGATGLGKTHLSLAIANEVIRKGMSVVYVSTPDILAKIEREHFSYHYQDEENTMASLLKCDLLILDDLGTEFVSQFSIAAVYNIFNTRILNGKPVIMNTNLTLNELLTTYSQRFVSRLMGSCDRLEFIGEDIRMRLL